MLIALSASSLGFSIYQSENQGKTVADVFYVSPAILTITFVIWFKFVLDFSQFYSVMTHFLCSGISSRTEFSWKETGNSNFWMFISLLASSGNMWNFYLHKSHRIYHRWRMLNLFELLRFINHLMIIVYRWRRMKNSLLFGIWSTILWCSSCWF